MTDVRGLGVPSAAKSVAEGSIRAVQRATLITACLGNFVLYMAINPVAAIAPTIATAFHADIALAGWLMSLYFLAVTSSALIAGRLGDLFGHSRMYQAGIMLFTIASLGAGLSQGIYQLLAARGFQGIAAALMLASGYALIGNHFPVHQRGRAVGLITTVSSIGGLFGIFLSTFLLPALGWRWIFFAMVPLGLLGIWGVSELRKVDHERYPAKLDWAGSLLLFLALATLSLSFHHLHGGEETFDEGWAYHLSMHTLTALLLGVLLLVELRSPAPLIQVRVLTNGGFSFAIIANGICHSAMMGSTFLLPFLVERGLGLDAQHTGILLMAMALMMTVSGLFGGWLHDRFRSPLLAPAGMGIVATGLVAMGLFTTVLSYGQFIAVVVVIAAAMGIFITVNNVQIISTLPNAMRGLAAGMEQSSRQLGHALGITATAIAMSSRIPRDILPSLVPPEAYVAGFQWAVLLMGAIAFLGAALSLVRGARASIQLSSGPLIVPAPLRTAEGSSGRFQHELKP